MEVVNHSQSFIAFRTDYWKSSLIPTLFDFT